MGPEDRLRTLHARLFLGHQVEKKGVRSSADRWRFQTRSGVVRWSLNEINRPGEDGKSRAQESRHVRLTLMHGIDRLRPLTGSTTDSGGITVARYSLWSSLFSWWLAFGLGSGFAGVTPGFGLRGRCGRRFEQWGGQIALLGQHGELLNRR